MIKYIKRKDLDLVKYDACIEKSIQSTIYGFSWYLDIIADHWDVLVLDDYDAVMPIPWRRKYFIKYVYTPFWMLQLGVFSVREEVNVNSFLQVILKKFKFIELRMNTNNVFKELSQKRIKKYMQILPLGDDYETIFSNYRKDRKKDLQKAKAYNLKEKWNDDPNNLIQLFKENVGKRVPKIKEKDYKVLDKLINTCIGKKRGVILSIYDNQKVLVASVFLLKYKNTIIKVVSSTNFKERKNGANTFMIDRIINKYQKENIFFDFGGSSIKSVANFSNSFNAINLEYDLLKHNSLPILLKIFKR